MLAFSDMDVMDDWSEQSLRRVLHGCSHESDSREGCKPGWLGVSLGKDMRMATYLSAPAKRHRSHGFWRRGSPRWRLSGQCTCPNHAPPPLVARL